jgi:hypothetical protein
MRAQTDLPALGVALLLLTVTLVIAVTTATSALDGAERSPVERSAAVGVSDRLVSADAPLTARRNVLERRAIKRLDGAALLDQYGLPPDMGARVRIDGEVVASRGTVDGGTTTERIVLVERREVETIEPSFEGTYTVTLPRRTETATLRLAPPPDTTVRSVWADNVTLLANDGGLRGNFDLSLSPLETTQLRFEVLGPLGEGDVEITYYPPETRKAILEVTVDG